MRSTKVLAFAEAYRPLQPGLHPDDDALHVLGELPLDDRRECGDFPTPTECSARYAGDAHTTCRKWPARMAIHAGIGQLTDPHAHVKTFFKQVHNPVKKERQDFRS